jgi:hypothetical protein
MLYTYSSRPPDTTFTVRAPTDGSSPWDPQSYPPVGGCHKHFDGVNKPLAGLLDHGSGAYDAHVAREFRQWVTLCTIPGTAQPGTYFVQVQTNGPRDDPHGDGHNRFALRAYGVNAAKDDHIAIAGFGSMAIYANLPSARTTFYLARVPPGAGGQILQVRLWDIGDSEGSGTVTVLPPADSGLTEFTDCHAEGPTTGRRSGCSIPASSRYNGRWETISVPLPKGYHCHIAAPTGCWIRLRYDYGSGNQPSDTTSWQATLEGNPVRLTK